MSIFRQFVCGQQSDNKPEEPVRWPGLTRGAKKWWAANAWNFSCLEVWANHSENKKYNQKLLGKVPLSNILYRVLILEWGFTMKPRESGCGRNQFFSKVSKHTFFAKLVSQPKFLFALRQSFLAEPNLTTATDQSNSCVLHASIIEAQSVQWERTCELLVFYSHAEAQGSGCEKGDPWCQSWI